MASPVSQIMLRFGSLRYIVTNCSTSKFVLVCPYIFFDGYWLLLKSVFHGLDLILYFFLSDPENVAKTVSITSSQIDFMVCDQKNNEKIDITAYFGRCSAYL